MMLLRTWHSLPACLILLAFAAFPHLFQGVTAFTGIRESSPLNGASTRLSTPLVVGFRSYSTVYHATPGDSGDEELGPNLSTHTTTIVKADTSDDDVEQSLSEVTTKGEEGKDLVITALLSALVGVAVAAKTGILPGPLDVATGAFGVYTDGMILRDVVSTLVATALAFVFVKVVGYGYDEGYYDSKVSRKLTHTFVAPLFILIWPIFSPAEGARLFAAIVTGVNILRLYLAGTSEGESSLAKSVSRSGDKAEALGGPLIYVCLVTVFTLAFWKSSMIGVVAASTMAAGDGMADLVGRKFGKDKKWWFSESKSVSGTVAFAIASSFSSYGLVNWLQYTGCLQIGLPPADLALRIVVLSVVCAGIELLPIGDDNYTVPLSAAVLSALLLY